jgi:1-deoxy-D-xylulose-5-phosphate reductoisomerase
MAMKPASAAALSQELPRVDRRRVSVLGATGSVGRSTLDVISRHPDQFEIVALTAHRNVEALAEAARHVRPQIAVIGEESHYAALKSALAGTGIAVAAGPQAMIEAAERPADIVMAAIVGAAGLPPTLAAVRQGCAVAFANKECLVCAGPLMVAEVARHKARLLPVDSEHNAIFQVLDQAAPESVRRLIVTASGGPFRTWTRDAMRAATPAQAVAHPIWSMGAKISVDSATMMNKGLEIIEAHFLFGMEETRIDVLVHPQSVIHSMVEYCDGSTLAQLGTPDMRTPIAHALAWPQRLAVPVERLDLAKIATLSFEAPDPVKFPALRMAREALKAGGGAPTVLNAANEIAVQAFLDGRIGFLDIERVVEEALGRTKASPLPDLESVFAIDAAARRHAEQSAASIAARR